MRKDNGYMTGYLLDYEYLSKHYRLIAIDLTKQIELEKKDITQQINFIGSLDRNEGATMFSIIQKTEETSLTFSLNTLSIM